MNMINLTSAILAQQSAKDIRNGDNLSRFLMMKAMMPGNPMFSMMTDMMVMKEVKELSNKSYNDGLNASEPKDAERIAFATAIIEQINDPDSVISMFIKRVNSHIEAELGNNAENNSHGSLESWLGSELYQLLLDNGSSLTELFKNKDNPIAMFLELTNASLKKELETSTS